MKNYNLKLHNTFGIEAVADEFLEYHSEEELLQFVEEGRLKGRLLHIGAGSNLLFVNPIFHGTVLHSLIKGIEIIREDEEHVWVRVGAGEVWDDFVAYCVEHQWYGAENLSLVPGEVGAAAVQNIGAYGVEVKDLITIVETLGMDGVHRDFQVSECEYAYRDSIFKRPDMKHFFVTHVQFCLSKKEQYHTEYGSIKNEIWKLKEVNIRELRNIIIAIRQSKLPDPLVLGNAGSFFKNPVVSRSKFEELNHQYERIPYYEIDEAHVKIPAGWLIEQTGWKGQSLGPAAVHDKQALVLVNRGGATGADIVALSDTVRRAVFDKFGIEISPEVNFIS